MTEEKSVTPAQNLRRRSVVSGVAWSIPAVAVAVATPAAASSTQTPPTLTLTPYDPNAVVPLQVRVGYDIDLYAGDIEVRLTNTATGAPVNNAAITFQLIPGTGSASFGNDTGGVVVATDDTNSSGRADSPEIYGASVGSATLVVSAPGANSLTYPITIMHTAVLQLESAGQHGGNIDPGETYYLDARVDLDLGARIDNEAQPVHLTFKNMPSAIYGEPTLGRPSGDQHDSFAWTIARNGDDIVLTRAAGYTRQGFDGADGYVYLTFTRPAGTAVQDVDVTIELSADNPGRLVEPTSQTVNIEYA